MMFCSPRQGTHDELVASKGKYAELMAIRNDGDD